MDRFGVQSVIDRAVNIATKSVLNGHPVERIIWMPPSSAASDPGGVFAIKLTEPISATDTAPWDR